MSSLSLKSYLVARRQKDEKYSLTGNRLKYRTGMYGDISIRTFDTYPMYLDL